MNNQSRIVSILKATSLDSSITDLPAFHLSALNIEGDPDFQLPSDLRLGHLVERVVSELIKSSDNYNVLYENIQIIEGKNTIGEIDFIIEGIEPPQLIHLELAYKFYLYDPNISAEEIQNWIGPNRNDSLSKKLDKLKTKQFPLLHHQCTGTTLHDIPIQETSQALCLLVSLYIPYEFKTKLSPVFQDGIKGYYLNLEDFSSLDNSEKSYYLPPKKEWGIDPSENECWTKFEDVENHIIACLQGKQAPLCWQKDGDIYSEFFIVWW